MPGPIVGVVPDETVGPGFYRVHYGDGSSTAIGGPTGQGLYDQQQARQALSPPPAPAGPDPRFGAPQLDPNFKPPPERQGTTTVEQPDAKQPRGPQTPQGAPPSQPAPLGYTMKATDPGTGKEVEGEAFQMPDGSIGVYRAPTRGSPGGLTSLGKQTMAQYGEAQIKSAEHSARAAEAQQVGVDLAVQDAEARQAYLDEQKIQNQLEMQRQADEEADIQKKVQGLEVSYQKAAEEFRTARVDPNRYVNSKKGGNWILGLSAALGAFGAAMARTPNFAMDFINQRIGDDIRSQEAEINVKGRDADNQLANLTRSLGDLKLAKASYRQLKLDEASLEAQRVSGQFKGQQIANTARMVAEQSAAEAIKAGEQRSREFVEHVMKDKLYYRQGSAGSSGGFLTPTQDSYQSARASNIGVEDLKLRQQKQAAKAGAGPHLGQRAQGQIVAARNARGAILETAQSLGMSRGEDGAFGDPSLGSAAAAKVPYSETRQKLNAAKLSLIAEVGKAQTGGALTEAEAHEMKDQISSSSTPGELGALVRHYDHMMHEVEKNVREVAASSGPGSDEPDDGESGH